MFVATLTPMLMLFFCMAIGFIANKTKILPDSASQSMAKLETWIFCPALNFMTMVRYCTVESLSMHAVNVGFSAIAVGLSMAFSLFLVRFFVKEHNAERGVYSYALAFANSGYFGDPIVQMLFGDQVLSYYKLFCLPISMVIYTWGISVLTPADGEKRSALKRLMNAPTIAMLVGIAVGLSGLGGYLPNFVTSALDAFKACMGPVGMLLAGFTVARYDFLGMLKKKKVYIASAFRLVILPTVIIAVLWGVKLAAEGLFSLSIGNDVLFLAFFAIAAPLGLNTVVFPEAYGGNPETGASMTMISHVLGVFTVPLLYLLMVALFGVPFT